MNARHFLVDTFAHMPPAKILADISEADGIRQWSETVHSIAEIVAHMDFWQVWFLRRCGGEAVPMPGSAALGWPAVSGAAWPGLRDRFLDGLNKAAGLGDDEGRLQQALTPPIEFPPLASYTVGDALVHMAGHNSHHLGQIVTLRQVMGRWPPSSGSWTW
jgi:uncharacterized damage-inducible protein DinB